MIGITMRAAVALLLATGLSALAPADSAKGAPPQVLEHVQSKFRVPVGSAQFKLLCPVISPDKSSLMVEWTKNGETIDPDETVRVKLSKNQRELRIKNVVLEDSGLYECQATNGFGHRVVQMTLHVFNPDSDGSALRDILLETRQPSPPEWQPGSGVEHAALVPLQLRVGDRLELRCPARGNPLPEIRWYKDNILLQKDDDPYSAVFIREKIEEDSAASYRCVVENNLGSIDAVFRVRIRAVERTETPTIDQSFNSSVKAGHTAQLQCKVKAASRPIIKWFKQLEDAATIRKQDPNATVINNFYGMALLLLDQPQDVVNVETQRSGEGEHTYTNRLVLPSVRVEHAGRYVCVVTSATAQPFNMVHKTAQLDVIEEGLPNAFSSDVVWMIMVPAASVFVVVVIAAIIWLRCTQDDCVSKEDGTKRPPPPQIPLPAAPAHEALCFERPEVGKAPLMHNLDAYFPRETMHPAAVTTLDKKAYLHRGHREDLRGSFDRSPGPYWTQARATNNSVYGQHYRTLEPDYLRRQENHYDSGSGIDQAAPFLRFGAR